MNFTASFADIEVDLAGRSAHIAEIRIGHFSRSVHDTSHDGDLDALEMGGGRLDAGGRALQVEEGAPAAWAGDIVGLEDSCPGGLKDVVGEPKRLPGSEGSLSQGALSHHVALHEDGIADAVAEQRADVRGRTLARWGENRRSVGESDILQEDGMPRLESCGQHPEGRDNGKIEAISHCHEQITRFAVHRVDFVMVAWIHFADAGLLIDDLGLIVAEAVEFVGDFVVRRSGGRRRGPALRLQASRR